MNALSLHETITPYAFALAALCLSPSVFANISDGSNGTFELSTSLTLPITGSTTFNFTTFSILSGGVLDFSGASANDTISILATGNVLIDGVLNSFPSILMIETPGSITINGSVNFNNSIFLNAYTININGVITNAGSSQPLLPRPNADSVLGNPQSPLPVPEADIYSMLLAGLSLISFTNRRRKTV